jgi:hypothetical protein
MLVLATYPSSQAALRAESRLQAAGAGVELIPVPRQVRSSCGFGLLVELEGNEEHLLHSAPEGLWRVLPPLSGTFRRLYEPYP